MRAFPLTVGSVEHWTAGLWAMWEGHSWEEYMGNHF